jgi:hypothetical protein
MIYIYRERERERRERGGGKREREEALSFIQVRAVHTCRVPWYIAFRNDYIAA